MDKTLTKHVQRIKSAMNRGKFDPKKVNDWLAMRISMTVIDRAIQSGNMTEQEFKTAMNKTKAKK